MTARSYLRSFAAGEITPEMHGRIELRQFQTGAARMRNFRALPHGPAENRAGFPYVIETKDSTKKSVLLPFVYSSDQSIVLEFGDQYIRFHTLGGTVLLASQSVTAVTKANPGVLTYSGADSYANGDWVYLSGIGGMTQLNGRYAKVANVNAGANTFELKSVDGTNIDTTGYSTYTSGGTVAEVYEIASPYTEDDLFDLHFTQSADVLTITHPDYQQRELSRTAATSWSLATLAFAPTQAAPAGAVTVTPNAAGGTSYSYVVTSVATDGLEESLSSAVGTNAACQVLTAAGAFNTVTWTNASGAIRYNVYKLLNGVYGYIGQAADGATGFKDDNITPDFSQTPPIGNDPFTADFPGAVGYHRGRRWFAGTLLKPQNLWGTRSGTEKNLTYSIPTQDNDSIQVRLTSRQANTIRHIVPLNDLLLLTSGAEWLVTTANSDVMSPTSIDYKAQGYIGASNVPPVVTSQSVIYAQARGGRVREMKYSWNSQKYDTNDISIMAPHLFKGYTIKQMAFQTGPYPTVWAVRSDGILLGLTYMPEQEVMAWHWHDTDGEFESVCVVPESSIDAVYVITKRVLNGRTVRAIERQDDRIFDRLHDAIFLDCGASLYNTVAATLTPGTGANVEGTEDVVFTAGSAVFALADVGRFIHYDFEEVDDEGSRLYKTAVAEITEYTDTTHVKARIDEAWPDTSVIASAGWRMTTTTVTGLWHLEGETVRVLADGAVHPDVTVANGSITLEQGASVVHAGLGYKCDFKTLPLVIEIAAFGQTVKKNVNSVHLRVYASSGVQAGPSFDKLREVKQRTTEPYGTPPDLATGRYNVMITPNWDNDAAICVRQEDPLPLTLVALAPEVGVGG